MKARIKKTGEIIDVYHEPQHGQVSNIYKESVFVNGRMWQENELEFIEPKDIDLEKEIELIKGDYKQVDVAWNNDFDYIARHFFELGLKAQKRESKNSERIPNIVKWAKS